jgi:hypothetical protein
MLLWGTAVLQETYCWALCLVILWPSDIFIQVCTKLSIFTHTQTKTWPRFNSPLRHLCIGWTRSFCLLGDCLTHPCLWKVPVTPQSCSCLTWDWSYSVGHLTHPIEISLPCLLLLQIETLRPPILLRVMLAVKERVGYLPLENVAGELLKTERTEKG